MEQSLDEIRKISAENNAIFYRLELDIPTNSPLFQASCSMLQETDFRKAFEEMQPEHSLILDLTQSEEEILAQMKQKGRYNIKIAERSGIAIRSSSHSGPELDNFYCLYQAMAKRQRITYRDKKYFEALLDLLGKSGYARIYNAAALIEGKEKVLAGAILLLDGKRAIYLFGGSSSEHRNVMAPYRLQWQMILDAKKADCTEYDFFGIAPDDDPNHPWAGVTRFKKQFGGQEIQILGSYDLVFKPLEYQAFKIAERIRRH